MSYQWVFNNLGNRLPGATNDTLILPNVQESNAGNYRVVITNDSGSVLSTSARLTVVQPVVSPTLVSASSVNGVEIGLRFSQEMSPTGLSLAANYQVAGDAGPVTVSSVLPWPGNTSVVLRLSAPVSGSFRVSAQSLRDLAGTLVNPASVTGRVWRASLAVRTVGSPGLHSQLLSWSDGQLTMRGEGTFTRNFDYLSRNYSVQPRMDTNEHE